MAAKQRWDCGCCGAQGRHCGVFIYIIEEAARAETPDNSDGGVQSMSMECYFTAFTPEGPAQKLPKFLPCQGSLMRRAVDWHGRPFERAVQFPRA
eukprot:5657377-Lingulodinium_polyedra.AAC.1